MKWVLLLMFILIPVSVHSEDTQTKWPDCYCTDKTGARVELGTMVCMRVGGRDFIARCEMSLNNPMWREISQGCLSSAAPSDASDPVLDAPLINAKI